MTPNATITCPECGTTSSASGGSVCPACGYTLTAAEAKRYRAAPPVPPSPPPAPPSPPSAPVSTGKQTGLGEGLGCLVQILISIGLYAIAWLIIASVMRMLG